MSWRPKWYDALPVLAIGVFGMVGPEGWPRQVAVGLVTFLAAAAPALAEFGYLELFSYRCPKCKQLVDVTLGALLG